MTEYRLISEPPVDLDVEAAFEWYENERPGLGVEFLDELRAAYNRIADGPLKYQELRGGIRRALLRRFPYAVYFAIEQEWLALFDHGLRNSAATQRGADREKTPAAGLTFCQVTLTRSVRSSGRHDPRLRSLPV